LNALLRRLDADVKRVIEGVDSGCGWAHSVFSFSSMSSDQERSPFSSMLANL
jgi:hypothetical protein